MTEKDIRAFINKNQLSEEQAQVLMQKEKNGRARKIVLAALAVEARKARRRTDLKKFQDDLILKV